MLKLRVHSNNKRRKLEWRRAHYSRTKHSPLTRLTLFFCSYSLKNTNTHARTHTHARKSILSEIIFLKCFFEQDFRWFIANRKGKIVPKKNKLFKYTKRKKITQTTQLQKKWPSSSLTSTVSSLRTRKMLGRYHCALLHIALFSFRI